MPTKNDYLSSSEFQVRYTKWLAHPITRIVIDLLKDVAFEQAQLVDLQSTAAREAGASLLLGQLSGYSRAISDMIGLPFEISNSESSVDTTYNTKETYDGE